MLVVPIRRAAERDTSKAGAAAAEEEEEEGNAAALYSNEPAIGVIQCINKLGDLNITDGTVEAPSFSTQVTRPPSNTYFAPQRADPPHAWMLPCSCRLCTG